jgi:hypothetical protein
MEVVFDVGSVGGWNFPGAATHHQLPGMGPVTLCDGFKGKVHLPVLQNPPHPLKRIRPGQPISVGNSLNRILASRIPRTTCCCASVIIISFSFEHARLSRKVIRLNQNPLSNFPNPPVREGCRKGDSPIHGV